MKTKVIYLGTEHHKLIPGRSQEPVQETRWRDGTYHSSSTV